MKAMSLSTKEIVKTICLSTNISIICLYQVQGKKLLINDIFKKKYTKLLFPLPLSQGGDVTLHIFMNGK